MSRFLTQDLIDALESRNDPAVVTRRDLAAGVPHIDEAWIDMVARARLTIRYTDSGPVGLLTGKKAYVVVTSGGVPVDSAVDFATPYLRHALGFIGIDDVEVIAADRLNSRAGDSIDQARLAIADAVFTERRPTLVVAQ